MNKIEQLMPNPSKVRQSSIMPVSILLVLWLFSVWPASIASQDLVSQNGPDAALRSVARVDPATLGMNLEVPIGSFPGRGISLPLTLFYSSKVWRAKNELYYLNINFQFNQVTPIYGFTGDWTSSMQYPKVDTTPWSQQYNANGQAVPCSGPPGSPCYYVKRVYLHMPDGSTHEMRQPNAVFNFPVPSQKGVLPDFSGVYYSVDSSQMRLVVQQYSSETLYMPDGSYYLLTSNKYVEIVSRVVEIYFSASLLTLHFTPQPALQLAGAAA